MFYLWLGLGILGVCVLLLAIFMVVMHRLGKSIPVEHQATSVIRIAAPVDKVFEAIADISSHPTWSKGVSRVLPLPDQNGMPSARMTMGRNSFILVQTRTEPPHLLERTIADDNQHFSGTWLYKLTQTGPADCEVKLTETGRVPMPAARAMMKHLFGYHKYTSAHLNALAAKFQPNPPKAHRA